MGKTEQLVKLTKFWYHVNRMEHSLREIQKVVEAQSAALDLVQDWAERGLIDGYDKLSDQMDEILEKANDG